MGKFLNGIVKPRAFKTPFLTFKPWLFSFHSDTSNCHSFKGKLNGFSSLEKNPEELIVNEASAFMLFLLLLICSKSVLIVPLKLMPLEVSNKLSSG